MGQETLIKSVVQALPTYLMSIGLLPTKLLRELDSILRRFWWNPRDGVKHYWTPMAWSSLCKPREGGGLGFRKFADFNLAILAKLAWWVLTNKDCLCAEILEAKYKVGGNWLIVQMAHLGLGKAWRKQKRF